MQHDEGHIARKRAAGQLHLDCAAGGAGRDLGFDEGTRNPTEGSCDPVERDVGRAGEIRP